MLNFSTIQIEGTIEDDYSEVEQLRICDEIVPLEPNGNMFSFEIKLNKQGMNEINMTCTDKSGNISNEYLYVTLDTVPPLIDIVNRVPFFYMEFTFIIQHH